MELRQLITETERALFERGLSEARATHHAGFRETHRSRTGQVHLMFGNLYGVFDDEGPEPDRILCGFALHSLDEFTQSYPKPDLTHYPPAAVFEAGELWSASRGAAIAARHGCGIMLGLRHARALLVYPIVKPWDLTVAYQECRAVGEPILWPYAETLDGEEVWVQAMVLEGAALRATISEAWDFGFETRDHHRVVSFGRPSLPKAAAAVLRPAPPHPEHNGSSLPA